MRPHVEDEPRAHAAALFRSACVTHGAAVFKEVCAAVERHNLKIGDAPLPVNPKPAFATHAERALFAEAAETIARILEKAVRLFRTHAATDRLTTPRPTGVAIDEDVPHSLLFDALGEHVRTSCVMRFDAAYRVQDGVLKFLEFNCDSPSGLGWHDALARVVENSVALSGLRPHFDIKVDALAHDLGAALLDAFREHCRVVGIDAHASPRVCVVGRRESPVFSDVRTLVEAFREAGLRAVYADPREFDESADGLMFDGRRVDLIYRDGIQELISPAAFDRTRKILDACRRRKVCVVNPLAARRMSHKSLMALMSDPATNGSFSEDERQTIARFLPWTRVVRAGITTFDGRPVQLERFIIDNQLKLIMKPVDGYGGRDVLIGSDADAESWHALLARACTGASDYLVQEYVAPGIEELPRLDPDGQINFHPAAANLGLWVFNQRFAGAYVRASKGHVVNVHRGGAIVPVVYLRPLSQA